MSSINIRKTGLYSLLIYEKIEGEKNSFFTNANFLLNSIVEPGAQALPHGRAPHQLGRLLSDGGKDRQL